jgi:hypothetical protein
LKMTCDQTKVPFSKMTGCYNQNSNYIKHDQINESIN